MQLQIDGAFDFQSLMEFDENDELESLRGRGSGISIGGGNRSDRNRRQVRSTAVYSLVDAGFRRLQADDPSFNGLDKDRA